VATINVQQRRADAKAGIARPDGSYPIRNQQDIDNAVKDWVRTGRPLAVKEWIRKRANALNLELPETLEAKGQPDEVEMAKQKTAA
jgi:hypothetical protein